MAMKLKCTCGHVLSVPEKYAGKAIRCPKCKKVIKVPLPKGSPRKPSKAASATSAGADSSAASGLEALFEEVGLTEKKGPVCPECSADVVPGAVLCTNCGYNFQTGERIAASTPRKAAGEEEEIFDNLYLQEAVENMKRDYEMDARRERAAMPWWVLLAFLIGAVLSGIAGVIIVDGKFGEPADEGTFIGKVQRWPVSTTLGLTALITGVVISLFAQMDLTVFGFRRSTRDGLLCLFLPLIYSLVYGAMNWQHNKAPMKAFGIAIVLIGLGIGLILQGGGFDIIFNAFR